MAEIEKIVRKFRSHAEADAAQVEQDMRLTPEQRIEILLELQHWHNPHAAELRFERVYRIIPLRGEESRLESPVETDVGEDTELLVSDLAVGAAVPGVTGDVSTVGDVLGSEEKQ